MTSTAIRSPTADPDRSPLHRALLALTLGTFAVGCGTYVVTGLLRDIAEGVGTSVGTTGHLVSAYAVCYAVVSPLLVVLVGRLPRRGVLLAAMTVFAACSIVVAVAESFGAIVAVRVAAAAAAAVFTPVAVATGAMLVAEERRGAALGLVMGGLTVAWVVGVPLGTLLGDLAGWRATFVGVGVLGAAAAIAIQACLPPLPGAPGAPLRSKLAIARRPDVAEALSVTLLGQAAIFAVLTYVRPLLDAIGGAGSVAPLLALFGAAGVAGTALGGAGSDRVDPTKALTAVLIVLGVALAAFSPLVAAPAVPMVAVAVAVLLVVLGIAAFAFPLLQQHRLISMAPNAADEALSFNASAIYLGQGIGAALGSIVLAHASLSALGWIAGVLAALSLAVLAHGRRPRSCRRVACTPIRAAQAR